MKRLGKEPMVPQKQPKRAYLTWNQQMDVILIFTLFEQINEGNKGDGEFKPQAYQAVADNLRNQLGLLATIEHVKNRIKVWKKHHSVITDIRNYTKFKWDDDKKMLVIPIEDHEEWNAYCKVNPVASAYRNKNIDHWDEMCTLFAMDRATGQEAEQHEESAAAMEKENETCTASEANSASSNKRSKKDSIVDAISRFTESFENYLQSNKPPPKPDSKEVYDVVSKVAGLDRHEVLKATKLFLKDTEEFDMLKGLPENEKLDWVLLCLNS